MAEANLFGVVPKARPARKAAVAAGEVQAVIGQWAALFEARFGEKPIITGKDGAAVKRLIGHSDLRTVVRRLPLYLDLPDEYLAGQGYPLHLMLGQWNRLIAADRPARASHDADRTEADLRRLKQGGGR